MDWTEIFVALIGLAGLVVASIIGRGKRKLFEARAAQAEHELKFQREAMDLSAYLEEWSGTQTELEALMDETCIDRFLMLRAWNGSTQPRWTTALYQFRQGNQKPVSYVHFELDQDYVERLKEMVHRGTIRFSTAEIPQGAIKSVYEAEGVTSSVWAHIETMNRTDGAAAITYCSFATHSEEFIPDDVVTRCRIFVGRLKGLAHAFHKQ